MYWSMCIFVLLASGIYLWWQDWQSAVSAFLIFLLMLTPTIAKERYSLYLPFSLDLSIVAFIFFTLFLGSVAHFYDKILFFDKLLHFQSGLVLGATGYILVYILNEHKKNHLNLSPGFVSLFAIVFSISIGVVWEVFEFTSDLILQSSFWQGEGITDTMLDLIADSVGALVVSVAGYFWMYRHKRLPFTPWLFRMVKEKLDEMKPPHALESRVRE